MTISQIRNKDRFIFQLCFIFWLFCLQYISGIDDLKADRLLCLKYRVLLPKSDNAHAKLRMIRLPICVSLSLFCLSLLNTTSRHLNAHLQYTLPWVSREAHSNTSDFFVLMSILYWSHEVGNRSSSCWCWENIISKKRSQTPNVDHVAPNVIPSSMWLWLPIQFTWLWRGPVAAHTPLSESNIHSWRLWLTPPTRTQTSNQGYSKFTTSNRRLSIPFSRNTP